MCSFISTVGKFYNFSVGRFLWKSVGGKGMAKIRQNLNKRGGGNKNILKGP